MNMFNNKIYYKNKRIEREKERDNETEKNWNKNHTEKCASNYTIIQ